MGRIIAAVVVVLAAGEVRAQQFNPFTPYNNAPGFNQPGQFFAPNFYNRANQPLSPYLNLVRPNDPAVNFFFRTRPGLASGGAMPFNTTPNSNPFAPVGFAPQQQFNSIPVGEGEFPGAAVPPTGHPVAFNYLPNFNNIGMGGQRQGQFGGGGGQFGGGNRAGGIGATPRPQQQQQQAPPTDPTKKK